MTQPTDKKESPKLAGLNAIKIDPEVKRRMLIYKYATEAPSNSFIVEQALREFLDRKGVTFNVPTA
jgi:hypothetical protein